MNSISNDSFSRIAHYHGGSFTVTSRRSTRSVSSSIFGSRVHFSKTVRFPKKKNSIPPRPLVFWISSPGGTCRTYPGRTPPRPPSVSWTSTRRRDGDSNAPATIRCRRRIRRPTTRPDGRALRTGPFGIRRRRTPARRTGTRPWPLKCRTRRRRSRPNLCEEKQTVKKPGRHGSADGCWIRVRATVSRDCRWLSDPATTPNRLFPNFKRFYRFRVGDSSSDGFRFAISKIV